MCAAVDGKERIDGNKVAGIKRPCLVRQPPKGHVGRDGHASKMTGGHHCGRGEFGAHVQGCREVGGPPLTVARTSGGCAGQVVWRLELRRGQRQATADATAGTQMRGEGQHQAEASAADAAFEQERGRGKGGGGALTGGECPR